jgi:hypothetical protein
MDKRLMEKLSVETSLLGFGCMRFPLLKNGKIDEAESEKMMMEAYRSGVNYFDTAYPYHEGNSEPFVGRVLDKLPRDSYFLATKLPCWAIHSVKDAKEMFARQLSRLNKDYVDFFLLHALGAESWERMLSTGVVDYCEQLKKEGKIRYLGFSFHDASDVFEKIVTNRPWDFCQIQLNYMDINEQAGMKGYDLATSLGIPVVIMEPIKGGSLAKLPEDVFQVLSDAVPGSTPSSWALRWVASLPNVKVILSGMSDMEQVKENCATLTDFRPLSEPETAAINKASEIFSTRIKNGCTACRYCMPCPFGVDIPGNFRIWNEYAMFGNLGQTKWVWDADIPKSSKAFNCTECGQCEAACPQNISIREDLKTLQKELDIATK